VIEHLLADQLVAEHLAIVAVLKAQGNALEMAFLDGLAVVGVLQLEPVDGLVGLGEARAREACKLLSSFRAQQLGRALGAFIG
jgi:hypothetical protein